MRSLFVLLSFIIIGNIFSQSSNLFVPVNMKKAFENGTRSFTGNPGKNYWQNKPEYKINIDFDPQKYLVTGEEKITYKNNSPDTLKNITITMLADIYKKDNYVHDWNIARDLMNDGIILEEIRVGNKIMDLESKNIRRYATNMFIELENLVLPHTELTLSFKWKYYHPQELQIREGNYGDSTFMVAYFYPKIAVYDDIDGWDTHIYSGFGEFFGEYADYDVNITVPGDFKVWATGELQNPEKVLASEYLKRWKDAHDVGKTIRIIDKDEVEKREVTKPGDKLTWHYKASHVPDFAFGTSNRFRWDARTIVVDKSTGRKTFMCTAYGADRTFYPGIIDLLDTVLTNYSNRLPGVPYPYPSMKIFNGNAGMEFPMMCNDAEEDSWKGNVGLTYHEVGHTYFPFFVGTNERKYAWMDEGWASYFPNFFFPEHIDNIEFNYFNSRVQTYYQIAGQDSEVPIFTLVDHLRLRGPYRQASYNKAFLAYFYLYNYLGEDRFLRTLQNYMNTWGGKHPIPFDFFNSFNTNSGENLDWFWQNWFFDLGYADLALELKDKNLLVKNIGHLYLPVKINIAYKDGTNEMIEYNMKIWQNAKNQLTIPMQRYDEIKTITLGADWVADLDMSNNVIEVGK